MTTHKETYAEIKTRQDEEIKNQWFKDHVMTRTEAGGLVTVTWSKPGTSVFYVRYVFDGPYMYVAGDLGQAVFWFTEPAIPERIAGYSLDYFAEKLRAFSDAMRDFYPEKANERLDDYISDETEQGVECDQFTVDALRGIIADSNTVAAYQTAMREFDPYHLGNDAWEWVYDIGSVIPIRVRAYLIGLQMATGREQS